MFKKWRTKIIYGYQNLSVTSLEWIKRYKSRELWMKNEYLNRHASPLTHIWLHGMYRIPKQSYATLTPCENGRAIIYITSKNRIFISGMYKIYHIVAPTFKNFEQSLLLACKEGNQMLFKKAWAWETHNILLHGFNVILILFLYCSHLRYLAHIKYELDSNGQ